MPASPFKIFPWQRPFLPDLKDLLEQAQGVPLIITPNERPAFYLKELYRKAGMPTLLPRFITFAQLVSQWTRPMRQLGLLDQIALLHGCIQKKTRDDSALFAALGKMAIAQFYPWGARLATLMEEIFMEDLLPKDLIHVDQEAQPTAAALLSSLGRIGIAWRSLLQENDWTTPGFDHQRALANLDKAPARFMPDDKRPVYIIGFHSLNGAQEKIFRYLWEAGATVCLHGDPALAGWGASHWSCQEQARLIRRWHARPELAVELDEKEYGRKPCLHFFEAYDCHSQLAQLRKQLKNNDDESSVIALANPELLMPTLHHLAGEDLNVSEGYPLIRASFGQLLADIFSLSENSQTNAEGERLFYWKDLLKIFNHPFLKMLGDNEQMRPVLAVLDERVRDGSKFVEPMSLLHNLALDEPLRDLLGQFFRILIIEPPQNRTLAELGSSLSKLCNFLLQNAPRIWEAYPMDAEALSRLKDRLLPDLVNNALAEESFSLAALHSILWELLGQERLPFEEDSAQALQILGMLETRLLHFDNVHVLDATSDMLPGVIAPNPLLPNPLRRSLGLPDEKRRQQQKAYNFFRLLASARNVYLYWQSGVSSSGSGLFDAKKEMSPFIQELIWQEEKSAGKLFESGQAPLEIATIKMRSNRKKMAALERGEELNKALERFLAGSISPGALDDYLQCPYKFALARLIRFAEPKEVREGEDPPLVGECAHKALENFYRPWLNREFVAQENDALTLKKLFDEQLQAKNASATLPVDTLLLLKHGVLKRFKNYFKNQGPTMPRALEKTARASLRFGNRDYNFKGRIDRLDERDGKLYLLDYKTGYLKMPDKNLWQACAFFDEIANFCAKDTGAPEEGDKLLAQLRENLPSLQLPCYLTMLGAEKAPLANAALIDLQDSGKENYLFNSLEPDDHKMALQYCRLSLEFVTRHLANASSFAPCPSKGCAWCAFLPTCKSQSGFMNGFIQ